MGFDEAGTDLLGKTCSGTFWAVDYPDLKFIGTLTIAKNGSPRLALTGSVGDLQTINRDTDFNIQGEAEGSLVSLFGCYPPLITHPRTSADINVTVAVIGALVDTLDTLTINSLTFAAPEISSWSRLEGLSRRGKGSNTSASYRTVHTKPARVAGCSIELCTGITFSHSSSIVSTEIKFTEQRGVKLSFAVAKSLPDGMRLANIVCQFLSLALRRPVSYNICELRRADNTHVTLLAPKPMPEMPVLAIEPLFPRPKAWSRSKVVRNWFDKYETLEPIILLRTALLFHPQKYVESEYLTCAQAIEALHRKARPRKTIVGRKTFQKLRQQLVDAIPNKLPTKSKLAEKIAILNEISLADRLKDLIKDDGGLLASIFPDPEGDAGLIAGVRNYLTHYETRKPAIKAYVRSKEFLVLTEKLRLLLEISIMREIGFRRQEVTSLVGQSALYRRLTRLTHALTQRAS